MVLSNRKEIAKVKEKIEETFGPSLSKETLKKGFVKSLTPLKITTEQVKSLYFSEFKERHDERHVCSIVNGVMTIKCYCNGFFYGEAYAHCEICLFEEGVILKHKRNVYFHPFSTVTIIAEQKYNQCSLNYTFDSPIKNLNKILKTDYYYSYEEKSRRKRKEVTIDTRHYRKDGKLDKRYSKQNESTGGTTTYTEIHAEEKFLVPNDFNYIIYVDNGLLEFRAHELYKFYELMGDICKKINLNPLEVLVKISNSAIPLLTTEDREKINAFLSKDYSTVIDESAIRTNYDLSEWEHLGNGKYQKTIIKDGCEQTLTRVLSKTINGVTCPFTEQEIEELIQREIETAKQSGEDTRNDDAEELLNDIIELRREQLVEMDEELESEAMPLKEFIDSHNVLIESPKSKDSNSPSLSQLFTIKYWKNALLRISMKIPGLSFSLKRAVGVTKVKQKIARAIGLPTTRQGLERKIGGAVVKAATKRKR